MIQEPQQPEIIEIPLANSMSTTVNSLSKNKLLSKNHNSQKNQNNNQNDKSQRTLIQIPQQNSKPRIFLLTRPSKAQLVRLETQTVRPHPQRNLNLSQHHHPQKTATVTSQTQTKIIRIPFLPRSQVQTFSVKSNTNQVLKKDSKVQYLNDSQVHQYSDHTQREVIQDPITLQQVNTNQLSPISVETSSDQLQTQPESVKNTIAKSTVNNLNLSENKSKIIQSPAKAQSEIPLTLASMAGIELTGADMSLSQADMSGAMPPTATVEEINVPVFIDEYLQEVTASTTSVTTNNIFNINNNNTNNNNISNNNHSNDKGNEVNNIFDTLDNFEFDINLLTENSSKNKETALEVQEVQQHLHQPLYHQQQQLTEVDDDKKLKQHQLELQMMLEDILFNNNNNNTSNNNTTYNINNSNNNNINDDMAANNDITEEIFAVAPGTDTVEMDLLDDTENSTFGTMWQTEDAVDFNNIDNDFSINDCFINSQPSEIMFSTGYSQSQLSQNLMNDIFKAEPHIKPNYSPVATTSDVAAAHHMEVCEAYDEMDTFCATEYIDVNSTVDCKETIAVVNPLKRNSSQTNQHMLEKRLKLRLDTKLCRENVFSQQSEITTPKVIDMIDQFNDDTMHTTAADSIKAIYDNLISTSPKCDSIKSEIIVDEISNDFSPPNTPYSVNSFSNHTSFINTAPSSPASSIATTTNASINTKRGRGRPAKTHSDIPDRSQIQHLSESEQKKVLERAKNNEASRKSRLKHKERDTALEREETELNHRYRELEIIWEDYIKMEKKLKAAVKRQYFKLQNDQ